MKLKGTVWMITSPFVSSFFRLILGAVFLYAGWVKASDPAGFAQSIYNYRLLPGPLINPMAIVLPWVELMVGLSLISGIYATGAAFVASGLLGTFAMALFISLLRGLDIGCGCFSTESAQESISWLYLARDLTLLGMAVHVAAFDRGWAWMRQTKREGAQTQ